MYLLDAGKWTGNIVALPNNRVRATSPALWVTGEGAPAFAEVESTDATLIESGEVDVAGSTRASVSDWLTNHVLKQKN